MNGKSSHYFIAYDEAEQLRVPERDSSEKLTADQAFIAEIEARVTSHVGAKRIWLARTEIRRLRMLCGYAASNEYLRFIKTKRLRVTSIQMYLAKAKDKLPARAAALVTEALLPAKPKPKPGQTYIDRLLSNIP